MNFSVRKRTTDTSINNDSSKQGESDSKRMTNSNKNFAVLIVFKGHWPLWNNLFLLSCSKNILCDFHIFTEYPPSENLANNIYFHKQTLEEFCSLASKKLNLTIQFTRPYKLCDFKPAYGLIFEDYISEYEFWGYCDVDLIFGKLPWKQYSAILAKSEILMGYKNFASGPFALFQNTIKVNNLFSKLVGYEKIFENKNWLGFDEHIVRDVNKGLSLIKGYLAILFILKQVFRNPTILFRCTELKYHYQWFVKRKTVDIPVDFTELIYSEVSAGRLQAHFESIIVNDDDYIRRGQNKWQVYYSEGRLIDFNSKIEMTIFHFGKAKQDAEFKTPNAKLAANNSFYITKTGFKPLD